MILILKSFDTNSIVSSIQNVVSVKMWSALWKGVVARKEIINKSMKFHSAEDSVTIKESRHFFHSSDLNHYFGFLPNFPDGERSGNIPIPNDLFNKLLLL